MKALPFRYACNPKIMVWYNNTVSIELSEEAENEKRMALRAIDLFKWFHQGNPIFAKALIKNNRHMSGILFETYKIRQTT